MGSMKNLWLMLIISMAIKTGVSYQHLEAPIPSPSYKDYLTDCAAKLHPKYCADQTYFDIFYGNETTSEECCKNLHVGVGKSCTDNLIKFVLASSPQFNKNETQIWRRINQIWNGCI
ncbi:hypothetical protein VNO80_30012 [Phaseolus coccineus]|uniref:Prolamin-like domain-containing protein n=1 Tax=Phaseolus coccineus TaxID=3886 RepID=A0AAN9LF48_PHACN